MTSAENAKSAQIVDEKAQSIVRFTFPAVFAVFAIFAQVSRARLEGAALTPQTFASLWTQAKQGQAPDDPELARVQKYMLMHDDLHALFDAFERDPATPPVRGGENLMLHIIMDATIEKALEWDQPPGIRKMLQGMLDGALDPAVAFHVLSNAMQDEFLDAAAKGNAMNPSDFMIRASQYATREFAARRGEQEKAD
jgi:hypothetical protein